MRVKKSIALGFRIRALRTTAGYSQTDVARALAISRHTYIRYEAGVSEPTFGDVCKLADLFGYEIKAFRVDGVSFPSS